MISTTFFKYIEFQIRRHLKLEHSHMEAHFKPHEQCQKLNLSVTKFSMDALGDGSTFYSAKVKARASVQPKINNYSTKLTFLVLNNVQYHYFYTIKII